MKKTLISFIIPCYGSELTISIVIKDIINVVSQRDDYDFEIIPVNDCSPDKVWEVLEKEAQNNKKVKPICLSKNMNRASAIMAGLSKSSGELIVYLDDDGQCPIENLWSMIEKIDQGADVVMAKYPQKQQSRFKNFGSWLNAKMSESLLNKPKNLQISNFAVLKKYIADEMKKYTNPYPYLSGLMLRSTASIENVTMEEHKRIAGNTGFTFLKMLALWLNGFTAFSIKPLRFATFSGILCAFLGFIYGIYIIVFKFVSNNVLPGYSSVLAAVLYIGGLIMLMLGIIGEYVGRIYISINKSPQFIIKKSLNFEENKKESLVL